MDDRAAGEYEVRAVKLPVMDTFRHGDWDLSDAIDALVAADAGAIDSGVRNPELKAAVVGYLLSLGEDDFRAVCARFARRYLSDTAIDAGYGLENLRRLSA